MSVPALSQVHLRLIQLLQCHSSFWILSSLPIKALKRLSSSRNLDVCPLFQLLHEYLPSASMMVLLAMPSEVRVNKVKAQNCCSARLVLSYDAWVPGEISK